MKFLRAYKYVWKKQSCQYKDILMVFGSFWTVLCGHFICRAFEQWSFDTLISSPEQESTAENKIKDSV